MKNTPNHALSTIKLGLFLLLSAIAHAQTPSTVECAGMSADGGYMLKVATTGSTLDIAKKNAQKTAVETVLFQGFAAGRGCIAQKPIIAEATLRHERSAYFDELYASVSEYSEAANQWISTPVRTKNGFKVEVLVTVHKDKLRKRLEKDGLIKALGEE